jgi:hypothetical protein
MLEIQVLLQYANMPEHRVYRQMWASLFRTTYVPLKQRLRNRFLNIHLEDIEEIVSNALSVFQIQLIKKAALREDQPTELGEKLQFIEFIENNGFTNYLFNLCNWMALDFLRTKKRRAMNITEIDNILAPANEREFYQDFEVNNLQPTLPFWWKKIENLLGPNLYRVFWDYEIEGLSHQEIAIKQKISEDASRERKSRAVRILRNSNLVIQFKKYLNSISVLIFFFINLF